MVGNEQILTYECPYRGKKRSECKAKIRVISDPTFVTFSIANMHDVTSHKEEKCKHMSLAQRSAVQKAIRLAPHLTPIAVRRNLKNLSPSKHVPASQLGSVRYAVRQERQKLVEIHFANVGVRVTDTHGSLTILCDAMLLSNMIRKHNDATDDYHMDMHSAICVAYHLDGGELFDDLEFCRSLNVVDFFLR